MVEHIIAFNKETKEKFYYYEIETKIIELRLLSEKELLVTRENEILIPVNATEKIKHFKLKAEDDQHERIYYKKKETPEKEHIIVQTELEKYFTSNNIEMFLEKKFPEIQRRADNYFEFNNQKYNIEVQQCRYSLTEFMQRTEDYAKIDIKVIWLVLIDDDDDFINKNFNVTFEQNGGFFLYLDKSDITENSDLIKNITKSNNELETSFQYMGNDIEDFIDFIRFKWTGFDINRNRKHISLKDKLQLLEKQITENDIFLLNQKDLNLKYEKLFKEKEVELNNLKNTIEDLLIFKNSLNEKISKEQKDLREQLSIEKGKIEHELEIIKLDLEPFKAEREKLLQLEQNKLKLLEEIEITRKELRLYQDWRDWEKDGGIIKHIGKEVGWIKK